MYQSQPHSAAEKIRAHNSHNHSRVPRGTVLSPDIRIGFGGYARTPWRYKITLIELGGRTEE